MSSILRKIGSAAFAASLLVLWPAGAFAAASPRTLTGHVPPQVRAATRLARLAADENVDLSLVVSLDQALLDQTLVELYGPNAAPNRHFLTPAEFISKFDLARKRQALKDFAASSGLTVDAAEDRPGSLVVKVSGPAARVENAFGVRLNRYRAADGQVFRAHETEPVIPAALAPHLHAVLGLSNYRGAAKPHLRVVGRVPGGAGTAGLPASGGASPAASPGTGPGGGLAPADIKSIYGLSLSLTGSGQTVALLELDGYNPSDIGPYETQFSLSSPLVTFVGVDGQANACGPNQDQACNATTFAGDGGMLEVTLDIDMMLALAPGVAQIRVYTALNTSQNLLDAYAKIASDNTAKSVSTSWGSDEQSAGGAFMTSESAIFSQMAAQGQTVFAAAGDNGAYDGGGSSTLLVDDPASQPYVTSVGGTTLSGTIGSHSETVWNSGGGGVANLAGTYWPLPSYQSGVAGTYSQQYRNVPDVTLNSDPNAFPYAVYVAGSFYLVGGTSAAAPLWAAVTALINQQRATNGYGSLGFANPAFYQLGTGASHASYFNDITSGNNGFYSAGTGYDDASGWGSFKANALINMLSAPLPPAGAVTNLTAAVVGVSSISWTWSALAGATGYDVYYATNSAQSLALAIQPPYTQAGLLGDATYGILVRGENQGSEGPGASLTTATYAAAPGAPPAATVFISSAAFTYAACPAFPSPSSCSGYAIQAAQASDFSGTVFSTATTNRALLALALPAGTLAANTGYFMRLGYLNPNGAPSFGASGTFNTNQVPLVAPVSPAFTQVSSGSVVFGWGQSTNPSGITYAAQASTAADFSGTLLTRSGTALAAGFGGLSSDASWYFRVQGLGGPFLTAGPQVTLAAAPAVSTNSFPVVSASGLTLAWSSGGNQPDTLYQADVSPVANFASGLTSLQVRALNAAFSGLTANTVYYARVTAFGRLGGLAGPTSIGSTTTLVLAPTLPGQPFSGQTTSGFTFAFNSANPAGTRYLVRVSTDPGFSVINASSNTASVSAAFAGLLSNQLYNVDVAGLNSAGSPTAFTSAVATATLVAAPAAAAVRVTTETATGFGFAWAAGTLAPGTSFFAQVSSSPAFAFGVTSSATANAFAAFAGLQPNTTYYGQVQAFSQNAPNPPGPFLAAAAGATLPNAPPAGAFTRVYFTSAAVAWTALPPAPSSAAAEGYLVQFATAPDFTTISASSAAAPGASAATVAGLNYATPYFARVGAVGWEGAATFLSLGSTTTALPPLSSGTVSASGITLTMPSGTFPQLSAIIVYVPPGAFPAGTPISAVANVGSLPAALTNEASSIVPFGANVGLILSAKGLQPTTPVTVTMAYDFTQIPAGQNESRLQLWRYDPAASQWTLIPSQVNNHVLTAQTPHFSTFSPFFVAAGTDVNSVQVWPQPWEIGDASSQYWASMLSFSNLPGGATVKIFTIVGELVWSGTAAADGTLNWNGNSRFGRRAASGTYFAAFQSGGQTKVRRLVIIR